MSIGALSAVKVSACAICAGFRSSARAMESDAPKATKTDGSHPRAIALAASHRSSSR